MVRGVLARWVVVVRRVASKLSAGVWCVLIKKLCYNVNKVSSQNINCINLTRDVVY